MDNFRKYIAWYLNEWALNLFSLEFYKGGR